MKASELRTNTVEELNNKEKEVQQELFNLRIQKGIGQTTQTHHFKKVRRNIARIKTLVREKEGSSI